MDWPAVQGQSDLRRTNLRQRRICLVDRDSIAEVSLDKVDRRVRIEGSFRTRQGIGQRSAFPCAMPQVNRRDLYTPQVLFVSEL